MVVGNNPPFRKRYDVHHRAWESGNLFADCSKRIRGTTNYHPHLKYEPILVSLFDRFDLHCFFSAFRGYTLLGELVREAQKKTRRTSSLHFPPPNNNRPNSPPTPPSPSPGLHVTHRKFDTFPVPPAPSPRSIPPPRSRRARPCAHLAGPARGAAPGSSVQRVKHAGRWLPYGWLVFFWFFRSDPPKLGGFSVGFLSKQLKEGVP